MRYATVEEVCDICGHKDVAVMPVERVGQGNECGECGNMSMYPRDMDPDVHRDLFESEPTWPT